MATYDAEIGRLKNRIADIEAMRDVEEDAGRRRSLENQLSGLRYELRDQEQKRDSAS